jgi:hypothetical protein
MITYLALVGTVSSISLGIGHFQRKMLGNENEKFVFMSYTVRGMKRLLRGYTESTVMSSGGASGKDR